jgi:hypothetical protein
MSSLSQFAGSVVRGARATWTSVAFANPIIPTAVVDPESILGTLSTTGIYTAARDELWELIVYSASVTSAGSFSFEASNGITNAYTGASTTFGRREIIPLSAGDTLKFKATLGNATAEVALVRVAQY